MARSKQTARQEPNKKTLATFASNEPFQTAQEKEEEAPPEGGPGEDAATSPQAGEQDQALVSDASREEDDDEQPHDEEKEWRGIQERGNFAFIPQKDTVQRPVYTGKTKKTPRVPTGERVIKRSMEKTALKLATKLANEAARQHELAAEDGASKPETVAARPRTKQTERIPTGQRAAVTALGLKSARDAASRGVYVKGGPFFHSADEDGGAGQTAAGGGQTGEPARKRSRRVGICKDMTRDCVENMHAPKYDTGKIKECIRHINGLLLDLDAATPKRQKV